MIRLLFLLAALLVHGGSVAADETGAATVRIETPWARATAPGAPVAAGYMTITNAGDEPDRLIGGSAPFSGRVEIHEMALEGEVMRMRELDGGLEIPPGGTVTLEPGGLHVMFMALQAPLLEGTRQSATLLFEKAGAVTVDLDVLGLGARGPGGGEGGHDHHRRGEAARD